MNFVVFRKDRLFQARERASQSDDLEAFDCVNFLLDRGLHDEHLVGIESMAPFHTHELDFWIDRLGLKWHENQDCVDFYFPSFSCERATWLEHAIIEEEFAINQNSSRVRPHWDAYRMVGDKSQNVIVTNFDHQTTPKLLLFPEDALTVDPANWEIDWKIAISIQPEIAHLWPLSSAD